jgi:hypothetical protein
MCLKVNYHVHKSPPLVPTSNHINPLHITPSHRSSILILSTHLHLDLLSSFFPSGFPTNILYAFSLAPFVLHVLPFSFSLPDYSNYIWQKVQVMKILIMQFSPTTCPLIPLQSKYSLQHHVLEHPQSMFLP